MGAREAAEIAFHLSDPVEVRMSRVEEIARRGTQLVPDEPEPAPMPVPLSPCGFCGHPKDGHGTRYSAFGSYHEWRRSEPFHWPLRPSGDPR